MGLMLGRTSRVLNQSRAGFARLQDNRMWELVCIGCIGRKARPRLLRMRGSRTIRPLVTTTQLASAAEQLSHSAPWALNACSGLIHSMSLSGGALTVNWHTRSLSPERLWGDFYAKLLKEIQTFRVLFGTAREIVGWFRERRALRFDSVEFEENGVHVALSSPAGRSEPSFILRIHHPRFVSDKSRFPVCMPAYKDTQWNGEAVLEIPY